jgi:hypothetical protein
LGDASFRTWCAYDALGIAAALKARALVEATCGQCQTPIGLAIRGGTPGRSGPEQVWLPEGGEDLHASFCTPTVLLCGDEQAAALAEPQDKRATTLSSPSSCLVIATEERP